jgi:branched-chain amino acid transport system ATP-binding protein
MTRSNLNITSLSKRFGGLSANDQVDMEVKHGEVHGLIGPNGAGKSTMLAMIGGQLWPNSGSIIYDGRDITRTRVEERAVLGIRRTFQNLKLFKELSVKDNVKVGLHTEGKSEILGPIFRTRAYQQEEREFDEKALLALKRVGLVHVADARASSLAYGHRRLLEIARAIVSSPSVLLLDEPAAGLNASECRSLTALIREFSNQGMTVVLVEHHMDVVMRACNSITVLKQGRRIAVGSPSEIQRHPEVISAYLGQSKKAAGVSDAKN